MTRDPIRWDGVNDAPGILLAAGAPAATSFRRRARGGFVRHGVAVDLATDDRAMKYGAEFPARTIYTILRRRRPAPAR